MPEVDAELATNMASDPKPRVRRELAQAIVNTGYNPSGDDASRHDEWIDPVVNILRADPSYHVRHILGG